MSNADDLSLRVAELAGIVAQLARAAASGNIFSTAKCIELETQAVELATRVRSERLASAAPPSDTTETP